MIETYEQMLNRHKKEIRDKQKECFHTSLKCSLDHTVIGRGSCTESIKVLCIYCGDSITIYDWHDNKTELIKYIESGKVKLDWHREDSRYFCDATIFYKMENPTKDYLYLKDQLQKAKKEGLK